MSAIAWKPLDQAFVLDVDQDWTAQVQVTFTGAVTRRVRIEELVNAVTTVHANLFSQQPNAVGQESITVVPAGVTHTINLPARGGPYTLQVRVYEMVGAATIPLTDYTALSPQPVQPEMVGASSTTLTGNFPSGTGSTRIMVVLADPAGGGEIPGRIQRQDPNLAGHLANEVAELNGRVRLLEAIATNLLSSEQLTGIEYSEPDPRRRTTNGEPAPVVPVRP